MIKTLFKYSLTILCLIIFHSVSFSQNDSDGEEDNGSNIVIVRFEIDEINMKFRDTKSFDDSFLKDLISERNGDDFDIAIYLQDVERLKKYYFDNGFFDIVIDTGVVYNSKDEEAVVSFSILENKRYRYYKLQYDGLDSVSPGVNNLIRRSPEKLLQQGSFYSKDSIKLEVARVLNILNNNGYATASAFDPEVLKYETDDNSLKNKVNVTLTFRAGLMYFFGPTKITFEGKKRYNITRDDISRELTYSENEIYDKDEVVNSELNISKLTILDNPRINIDTIIDSQKKVYLAINAVIGNKYSFTPELFGYYFQNVFYLGPGISFSDKNFFGGGRVLTTSARFYFHSFNDNRLEFVNSIFQPFLFNNRQISGTWNAGIQYNLDKVSNVTEIKTNFNIGYDLPSYTYLNRLNAKWNIENKRFILKEDLRIDTLVLPKFDYNLFTSTIGFSAIHNSVNNLQFPFGGSFQTYEIEESGLLGNLVKKFFNTQSFSYLKFTNFNAAYLNLSQRDVNVSSALAGKFSTGIIIEYGDNSFNIAGTTVSDDRVPTDKRFVCGGSSSIRGWGAKQLGIVKNKNEGGNFIFESSVEHRTRPFLQADNVYIRDLGFATFVDLGNVWSEIGKFRLNEIAIAAGAGIRYYTIIGAIRFDIGLKIYDPQPGLVGGSNWLFGKDAHFRDKYNFQFGIGNTF